MGGRSRLPLFALLFGFAVLSHQLGYAQVRDSPLNFLLTLAAAGLVLRPGSRLSFAVFGAMLAYDVAVDLPRVVNHWLFAGLLGGLVVLAQAPFVLSPWFGSRTGSPEHRTRSALADEALLRNARVALLLVYLIAGFHKLNTDFLTSVASCGLSLSAQMLATAGLSQIPPIGELSIAGTLLCEFGVPLLLLVPRTRRFGITLGVVFHLACAAAGYPRFSALSMALLALFLPPAADAMSDRFRSLWMPPLWLRACLLTAMVGAVLLGAQARDVVLGAILVAVAMLLLMLTWRPTPVAVLQSGSEHENALGNEHSTLVRARRSVRLATFVPALVPALLLLAGLTPYLGLGTERAFSMYSNLRTERGRSNHLFVPASWQSFGYQRDLVHVREASVRMIVAPTATARSMPWLELRVRVARAIAARPDERVRLVYRRAGAEVIVEDAAHDPRFATAPSWATQRLLRFRAVEENGPRQCST